MRAPRSPATPRQASLPAPPPSGRRPEALASGNRASEAGPAVSQSACTSNVCAGVPKRRSRKPIHPPTYAPNRCVIVAADPGECSGWSIWAFSGTQHVLMDLGEVDVFGGGPQRVLEQGQALAKARGAECVLVVERPFNRRPEQGGFNTTAVGTADKIWREMAKRLKFARRVVRVYPSRWRATQLDKGWHKLKRPQVRAHEQEKAKLLARACGVAKEVGPDAAPAIMIGKWATHAGEVAAVLSKRVRGA